MLINFEFTHFYQQQRLCDKQASHNGQKTEKNCIEIFSSKAGIRNNATNNETPRLIMITKAKSIKFTLYVSSKK